MRCTFTLDKMTFAAHTSKACGGMQWLDCVQFSADYNMLNTIVLSFEKVETIQRVIDALQEMQVAISERDTETVETETTEVQIS